MTTPFLLVASSRSNSQLLELSRGEYTAPVGEMKRAFEALRAIFEGVHYDILCGVPASGTHTGHRLVEGTVLLDWGQNVPGSFKVRVYLDSVGEQTPIIDGLRQAMVQVFVVCAKHAPIGLTDNIGHLFDSMIELGIMLDRLKRGHHLEFRLESVIHGANMSVMAWIDGEQHVQTTHYGNTEIPLMQSSLLNWVNRRIRDMLYEENSKRMPPPASPPQMECPVDEAAQVDEAPSPAERPVEPCAQRPD